MTAAKFQHGAVFAAVLIVGVPLYLAVYGAAYGVDCAVRLARKLVPVADWMGGCDGE